MKRNLSSALRGRTAWSRKRDMALKVLVHNTMILKLRVETEPDVPVYCLRIAVHGRRDSSPGATGV
jgi:hypothetical protein